jgi:indole-3-glycerol phosphate synthase
LPLLCKEFVVDECQLDAAQAYGASAVLLIARCLSEERLAQLLSEATLRGLCPVVEVFTEIEALQSIDAGASFVGVNARDLDTLEMNAERAAKIIDLFPSHMTVAHLSGIKSTQDAQRVAQGRADAALIGEVLMRQDDPGPLLESLVEAAR